MTAKLFAAAVVIFAIPVAALAAVGVLAIGGGAVAATADRPGAAASQAALDDIGLELFALYQAAAHQCGGLAWPVLAGIAKIESDHGRFGGATIGPEGRISPPIIGVALDGTNGTAPIADTDGGRYDGDSTWDRAVGPFQFIASSWAIFGRDANGDGNADPHNIYDAAHGAVAHLCPGGAIINIESALFAYNPSWTYVAEVLGWAETYSQPHQVVSAGAYAYPLPAAYATAGLAQRTHHDYPAWDIATPVGTPTYAMVAGTVITAHRGAGRYPTDANRCGNTVTIAGLDAATYTYCHLSTVTVSAGQTVLAGATIGATGGQPGAPGAGNTTGPHLHLSVRVSGNAVCPQPLLVAILSGAPIAPTTLPATGCTH
ncbi:MAG: peptidoglycan DD-metalloendopeptidase family protein [Sulfitobacter sp.]|nr:peptidoglycan DD-metalloendopeptidase family protein [Sulfitobacter sp.]